MDLNAIIDIDMEVNQDIAFDRFEIGNPIEILDEDNLVIDMIVQQAAGATTPKSAPQK